MSLSIVFGIPTTRTPSSDNFCATLRVSSPPMATRASISRARGRSRIRCGPRSPLNGFVRDVPRMVPPRCRIPRTSSGVSSTTSSLSNPNQPLRMPTISYRSRLPARATALIAAFSPGASPPPVRTPIRMCNPPILPSHTGHGRERLSGGRRILAEDGADPLVGAQRLRGRVADQFDARPAAPRQQRQHLGAIAFQVAGEGAEGGPPAVLPRLPGGGGPRDGPPTRGGALDQRGDKVRFAVVLFGQGHGEGAVLDLRTVRPGRQVNQPDDFLPGGLGQQVTHRVRRLVRPADDQPLDVQVAHRARGRFRHPGPETADVIVHPRVEGVPLGGATPAPPALNRQSLVSSSSVSSSTVVVRPR